MPDDDLSRAERAFTAYFAEQAARIDATPIDPVDLGAGRHRPSRRVRWAAVAAAVALVVGAAAVVPLLERGHGREVTAVPVAPGGGWVRTERTPLGQRYGSINVWLDGAFLIVGGTSHCGLDEQGNPRQPHEEEEGEAPSTFCLASLPSPGERHADGARFDPSTGAWTTITDAPRTIGNGQGVVFGGVLYVATEAQDAAAVLRYDPEGDTWSELPTPGAQVSQLLAVGDGLYAVVGDADCPGRCVKRLTRWDPSAARWYEQTELPAPPPRAEQFVVSTDESIAVVSSAGSALWRHGGWQELAALPTDNVRWVGAVAGRIIATGWDERTAYALDLADPRWQRVDAPSSGQGGLYLGERQSGVPHVTDGTRATVAGRLYDPVAGSWTDVPRLPNPAWSFGAFAGNGDQVLACFVGPTGSMNDCFLLDLAAPTSIAAPVPVDEWAATAPSPLGPRAEALATRVGEQFLVIGGRGCGTASVQRRSDGTVACPTGDPVRDGAAYDPVNDRWRMIAAPPVHLDATARWAVLGQTLYAGSAAAPGLWAYDLPADAWRRLPDPPGSPRMPQLLAGNGVLLAFARHPGPDAWFDPGTGEWTAFPAGIYPNDGYPGEAERVVVATEKELLVGEPVATDDGVELRFTVFDVDTEMRLHPTESATKLASYPGPARAVVDDQATVALVPTGEGTPAYRFGGGGAWEPVPVAATPDGPLAPGLVAGSLVSLQGNLFNPGTGVWRSPAALPGGATAGAVQAAGEGAILSCFGVVGDRLAEGCHLLRL